MSSIANTIYQAIVTHTTWKKRLHEVINTGQSQQDLSIQQDKFHQWLKENADELSQYEQYSKIVDLNSRLHNEAQKIVRLALNGDKTDARAMIEYGSDFEHLSQTLVQNIIAWHDVVIGKNK